MPARALLPPLGRAIVAALLVLVALGTTASMALAHPGGPEQVIVAGDHVDPGTTFRVFASAIEPDVDVPVRVVAGSSTFELGAVHVASDGSFDVMLTLPADVPLGYAQLVLTQPTSGEAGTTFLVGPRAEGAGALAAEDGGSFLDSRLGATLVLVATLAGMASVVILLVRGRGRSRA